ncbi:MAG: addiction module protein [Prosthecobacter sp.]|nr:addiction module protein [Prosthecobacter sp.]HBJ82377.1 hypothetical protein [Verrucomicrobiales bacterium]
MTATLTPTVQTLIESFRNLSAEEQESFREEIAAGDGDAFIPEAHWEILMERERQFQQGQDRAIPWDEAKLELRKKWAAR